MQVIRTALEVTAQSYPDRTALQWKDVRLTFRQLRDNVANAAHHLQSRGITPNDAVVLFLQNTPSCAVCFLSLAWLGIAVIPLEPETSLHELDSIYDDIPYTAVLADHSQVLRLQAALGQQNRRFIDTGDLLAIPQDLPDSTDIAPVSPDKVFLYHYTSGSTGKPKAALHSQANLVRGGIIYTHTYQLGPEDSILVAVPLAHSFGMVAGLMASLISGSRLVMVERFIPRKVVEMLAEEGITVLVAVPLIYDLMNRCDLPGTPDLSGLRVCLSSGSPLLPGIAKQFQDRYGKGIYQVYGSTEMGVIAAQWPRAEGWPEGSVGRPLMDVYVRIVDEEGRDVPASQSGTLLVKTSTMFTGYHKHRDAANSVFQNGWYVTGDTALQDDNGNLFLRGRKNTFINIGGKKVNPFEVEEVLLRHPLVKEAMVYGKDAGNGGEQVQAVVVLHGKVSIAELTQFCRERLAFYKVPSQIDVVAALPKIRLGKHHRAKI